MGAVNNLLFAATIAKHFGEDRIASILDSTKLLSTCEAFFVEKGEIRSCIDKDAMLIQNEVIDGASNEINAMFDKLLEVSNGEI